MIKDVDGITTHENCKQIKNTEKDNIIDKYYVKNILKIGGRRIIH